MDDIAEHDDLARAVLADERGEALEGIIRRAQREELALRALGPDVAEVEIGDREHRPFLQPHCAPGVEVNAGGELVAMEHVAHNRARLVR